MGYSTSAVPIYPRAIYTGLEILQVFLDWFSPTTINELCDYFWESPSPLVENHSKCFQTESNLSWLWFFRVIRPDIRRHGSGDDASQPGRENCLRDVSFPERRRRRGVRVVIVRVHFRCTRLPAWPTAANNPPLAGREPCRIDRDFRTGFFALADQSTGGC